MTLTVLVWSLDVSPARTYPEIVFDSDEARILNLALDLLEDYRVTATDTRAVLFVNRNGSRAAWTRESIRLLADWLDDHEGIPLLGPFLGLRNTLRDALGD